MNIMKTARIISLTMCLTLLSVTVIGQTKINGTTSSAAMITGTIIKNVNAGIIPNTVDVIKEGDAETVVKGIVTTMFATMEVLKKAVDKNCNLIIVHEPLYYNHLDKTDQFKDNSVFLEKQRFIKDHNLVIWRFHDYIHSLKPDGIEAGMIKKLGWEEYVTEGSTDKFVLPETTLDKLLKSLRQKFPGNAFYVIGKPEMKLTNVRLAAGAPGSEYHIKLLEDKSVDVVLAGESPQWETYEYIRDAVFMGRNKAVIFLGHVYSEEAGMDYCAGWLKTFIKDVPVYYIESGAAYWSY